MWKTRFERWKKISVKILHIVSSVIIKPLYVWMISNSMRYFLVDISDLYKNWYRLGRWSSSVTTSYNTESPRDCLYFSVLLFKRREIFGKITVKCKWSENKHSILSHTVDIFGLKAFVPLFKCSLNELDEEQKI